MEELLSTEVLDREILEDARKKAFRILKTADDTVASQAVSWEKRCKRAVTGIQKVYAQRVVKSREEIMARLPLDKKRLRSEVVDSFLQSAMDSFLKSLSRADILFILEKELAAMLADCPELFADDTGPVTVSLTGLSDSEGEDLLKKAAGKQSLPRWTFEAAPPAKTSSAAFPGMVINARALKLSASALSAAEELLEDKRAELVTALLGEAASDIAELPGAGKGALV